MCGNPIGWYLIEGYAVYSKLLVIIWLENKQVLGFCVEM